MNKTLLSTVVVLVSLLAETSIANAATLPQGITDPFTTEPTAGTIPYSGTEPPTTPISSSDTQGLSTTVGDKLFWNHTNATFINDGQNTDQVKYLPSPITITSGAYSGLSGGKLLTYETVTGQTTDIKGYLLVADQSNSGSGSDVHDWVQLLGGNQQYVDINKTSSKTTLSTANNLMSWDVYWLPQIIAECGGTIDFGTGDSTKYLEVDSTGKAAIVPYKVTPTPSPSAQISTSQSAYNVGDDVKINATANVYAAATNWHMEAFHVTGPNGFDEYLKTDSSTDTSTNSNNGGLAAATGTAFPYYGPANGTLAEVYGGGSGDPSTPKTYQDVADLPTAGLTPGTYTVSYTLYDAVGRAASTGTNGTVTTTFTLDPAGTVTSPSPSPTGSNTNMNLSIKYNSFTTPIPVGNASVPVTVSNDGDQAVTTTVTLTRHGYVATPVYTTEYDSNGNVIGRYLSSYNNVPNTTQTSQTVTIPAHGAKQLTFSFTTGFRMTGLSYDPNYAFQIVADVNQNHSISESTYSDNEAQLWVKTTGPQTKPPTARLTE